MIEGKRFTVGRGIGSQEAIQTVPVKEIGNVLVEHNDELRFTHYLVKDVRGSGNTTEIYISDELKGFDLSFKKLKEFAFIEFPRVTTDPFGETSIDPHVSESFARSQRAVNRLKDDVQNLISEPIAIKSSVGIDRVLREDLIDQYLFMRQLQLTALERLTQKQKEIIEFLPVYAAIRLRDQDFLVMKKIDEAKEIKDQEVPYRSFGWPGAGDPDTELGFSASEHRILLEVLGIRCLSETALWQDVAFKLREILGIRSHDLAGRNVLEHQSREGKKYVVIDQTRLPHNSYRI